MDSNRPFGNARFGESPDASGWSNEIVDAEVVSNPNFPPGNLPPGNFPPGNLPPGNKGRGWLTLLIVGGLAGVLLITGLVVAGALYIAKTREHLSADQMLKIGDAKFEMVREGFSIREIEVSDNDFKAIDRTVKQVLQYSMKAEFDAVREFVDPDGFMDQAERGGSLRFNFQDRIAILEAFEEVTDGPVGFDHYKIASIKQQPNGEVIVFLYLWDELGELPVEYLWWMRKIDGRWKVIDWESMWVSRSEADEYRILWLCRNNPGIAEFYAWTEDLNRAVELIEKGEYEQAKQLVEKERTQGMHNGLRTAASVSNGWVLFSLREYESALKRVNRVRGVSQPGVFLLRARCQARLGRYDEAIENLDQYSEIIGFSPSATILKAACFRDLGRADEAIDLWLSIAHMLPGLQGSSENLVNWVPIDRIGELGAVVSETDDPSQTALDIGLRIYRGERDFVVEEMARVVERHGGDQAALNLLGGVSARLNWDYEAAAESMLRGVNQSTGDQQLRIQSEYLDLMLAMELPLDAYRQSAEKEQAFGYLTDARDGGDYDFPDEQFKQLLLEHRKDFPKSIWLDYYLAGLLIDEKKDLEAIAQLGRGIENARSEGSDDAVLSYERALTQAYLGIEKPLEAYRNVEQKLNVFKQVAAFLVAKKDIEGLTVLVEEHRQFKPDHADDAEAAIEMNDLEVNDRWVDYYQAVIDYHTDDQLVAIREVAGLLESLPMFQRYVPRNLLGQWLVETNSWQLYLKENATTNDEESEAIFSVLYELFSTAKSESSVATLIKIHQENGFPSVNRITWKYRDAVAAKDDSQVDRVLDAVTDSEWESIDFYLAKGYRQQWVQALLRMGSLEKAKSIAQEQDEPGSFNLGLFQVLVAEGDAPACRKMLEESTDFQDFQFRFASFAAEPKSTRYVEGQEFAELRTEFPSPIPTVYAAPVIQFAYDSNPPSVTTLQEGLAEVFGNELNFAKLDHEQVTDIEAVVGYDRGATVIASVIQAPLTGFEDKLTIPKQTDTLSITVRKVGSPSPEEVQRLAKQFCTASCVGVYFSDRNVLLTPPFSNQDSESSGPFSGVETDGVYAYLDRQSTDVPFWKRMKRSEQLVQAMKQSPEDEFEVSVEFTLGFATESHWFPVQRIEMNDHDPVVVVARDVPVQLFPLLQEDEPMTVRISQIVEWRIKE